MNTEQFIRLSEETQPAESCYSLVEKTYRAELPDEVRRIISVCDKLIFWDGGRFCHLLSLPEIVQAPGNLHIDFVGKRMIPFFDCGENDFIVYLIDKKQWAMFNIVDECEWKLVDSLTALLPA